MAFRLQEALPKQLVRPFGLFEQQVLELLGEARFGRIGKRVADLGERLGRLAGFFQQEIEAAELHLDEDAGEVGRFPREAGRDLFVKLGCEPPVALLAHGCREAHEAGQIAGFHERGLRRVAGRFLAPAEFHRQWDDVGERPDRLRVVAPRPFVLSQSRRKLVALKRKPSRSAEGGGGHAVLLRFRSTTRWPQGRDDVLELRRGR